MSIQIGDTFPSVSTKILGADGLTDFNLGEAIKGRKVVIFALPGAFTPACVESHLPGYMNAADEIKAAGVDEIFCLSVNDPFVMAAWGDSAGSNNTVSMVADGNCELTDALGLIFDASGIGLGKRSKRYSMIVNDGVVESLNIEESPGDVELSGAPVCLTKLAA